MRNALVKTLILLLVATAVSVAVTAISAAFKHFLGVNLALASMSIFLLFVLGGVFCAFYHLESDD